MTPFVYFSKFNVQMKTNADTSRVTRISLQRDLFYRDQIDYIQPGNLNARMNGKKSMESRPWSFEDGQKHGILKLGITEVSGRSASRLGRFTTGGELQVPTGQEARELLWMLWREWSLALCRESNSAHSSVTIVTQLSRFLKWMIQLKLFVNFVFCNETEGATNIFKLCLHFWGAQVFHKLGTYLSVSCRRKFTVWLSPQHEYDPSLNTCPECVYCTGHHECLISNIVM